MSEHLRKMYIKDDYYEELNETCASYKELDPEMINGTAPEEYRFHKDKDSEPDVH